METEIFPLSSKYDKHWVNQNSYDGLTLYCTESLCQVLNLNEGMRVLDLGCGWAISSIFLAREFGVQAWGVDLEISASANYTRILEAGCNNQVYPLKCDARRLPFPEGFFDAIISIDAYSYFGMDERFLSYLVPFLKPEGCIGIVEGCFAREISSPSELPGYLKPIYWDDEDPWYAVHSAGWWKNFWEKTGLVRVFCSEILPQNEFIWQEYIKNNRQKKSEQKLIRALSNDTQNLIGLFRLAARRISIRK